MKAKSYFALLLVFAAGATVGAIVTSFSWLRVVEDLTLLGAQSRVSNSFMPLHFIGKGETNQAVALLRHELQLSLQDLQIQAETFNRPDQITNSLFVKATQLSEHPPGHVR